MFSLEMNFGIMASCIATLKPLLERAIEFTRLRTSRTYPSSNTKIYNARRFKSRDTGHGPKKESIEHLPLADVDAGFPKRLESV